MTIWRGEYPLWPRFWFDVLAFLTSCGQSGMSEARKREQLNVSLNCDIKAEGEAGWGDVHLLHQCLPEIDRDEIDLSVRFCGRTFRYPLMISALTGGCPEAVGINEALAQAAERFGIGMQLGSQAVLIDSADMEYTYTVARQAAPNAFLVANIGASRLVEQSGHMACGLEEVRRFIDIVRADALAIHLNFLQEAIMPEGDSKAKGCLEAIQRVAEDISVPVIVKETGAGMSREQAVLLSNTGVAALDIGGAGGTSMALVEAYRARLSTDSKYESLGRTFADWGIPTVVSLIEARSSGLPIVASGGITNGLEAAKALALGASLVGVARPLLLAAAEGYDSVVQWLELFFAELSAAMFLSSAVSVSGLRERPVIILGRTREWLEQLGYDITTINRMGGGTGG